MVLLKSKLILERVPSRTFLLRISSLSIVVAEITAPSLGKIQSQTLVPPHETMAVKDWVGKIKSLRAHQSQPKAFNKSMDNLLMLWDRNRAVIAINLDQEAP